MDGYEAEDPGDRPGGERIDVEVVSVSDPEAVAPAIALDRGAEVVADEDAAVSAVAARRTAHRTPIDDDGIAELRRLARELGQAERIRTHTEVGFRDGIVQRMARSTGLAVHPSSIRDAAETILQAERDLAAADAAIEAHITATMPARPAAAPTDDGEGGDAPDDAHPEMFDDYELDARRVRWVGAGLAVSAIGVGLILIALKVALPIAVGVAAFGVVVSVVLAARTSRSITAERPAPATTADHDQLPLADLLPDADLDLGAAPEGTPPTPPALQLDHNRAEERLRSATRHWETLVGPSADPHDLDAVLRAHDPQLDLATASAASPTVRAVGAVHRRAAARWRVAWAALGYPEAPAVDRVDQEIDRLVAGIPRPIVFVEPARWLAADRLASLLNELPATCAVTIIQRKGAS